MLCFSRSPTTIMFGTASATSFAAPNKSNPMKDFEVESPPEDTVSCMEFSPESMQQNFLIAGSWASDIRCWQVEMSTGKTVPKAMKVLGNHPPLHML